MRYLKRWEVLAFIGAVATFSRYSRQKIYNLNSVLQTNLRSIFVYATFTVTFSIVYAAFAACGYPNPEATVIAVKNILMLILSNEINEIIVIFSNM